ncbi:sigma-70 family RNA polymerase sigma factor [Kitasatospora sp. NPDC001527]|uniref:sigma-70 family RNA polymerase sigma factor n=1 Tax=Kitasatospora sp. NPDC001527 TaxID=3154519 RepID=UPI00331EF998
MSIDLSGLLAESRPSAGEDSLDEAAAVFEELRPRLFGIAYRTLESAVEAEDVVQDVWLRWQKADRSAVLSPSAFLSRATARLAINVARSARSRRQTSIDPWLPEPVDPGGAPAAGVERAEELASALLLLLERLTPTERAVYILREAFDYAYADIAGMLRLSVVNVRKITSRARKRLVAGQREAVDAGEHRWLLEVFVGAARTGDVASLESLLAPHGAGGPPAGPAGGRQGRPDRNRAVAPYVPTRGDGRGDGPPGTLGCIFGERPGAAMRTTSGPACGPRGPDRAPAGAAVGPVLPRRYWPCCTSTPGSKAYHRARCTPWWL